MDYYNYYNGMNGYDDYHGNGSVYYNPEMNHARVNASYTIKIQNDTPIDQVIIWSATGCGGIWAGRPSGQCTSPVRIRPGETVQHTFEFTLNESVLIHEPIPNLPPGIGGRWCIFPLISRLQGETLLLSRMLAILNEKKMEGQDICEVSPGRWYRIENQLGLLVPIFYGSVYAYRGIRDFLTGKGRDIYS